MSLSKKAIALPSLVMLICIGSFGMGYTGIDAGRAITQGRCDSGAFIAHADSPGHLEADARPADQPGFANASTGDAPTAVAKPVEALSANLIPNPGLENLSDSDPADWLTNRFSQNDATFHAVLGHDSGHAVSVDITKYQNGDADWYVPMVPAVSGGYYEFQDYYRSNVATRPTLYLKFADGHDQYVHLSTAPVAGEWTHYTERMFVPAGATQIQVFHPLDRVGSLETDDYSLVQIQPAGFSEPLITLTFDDGWKSIHDNALPVMQLYHVVSTQYLISGFLGQSPYDTVGDVYDFKAAGHEIASHTFDHKDLTTVSDRDLSRELTLPQQGLSKCFGPVTDFASPYGTSNAHTTAAVSRLYSTARSTDTGFNSADWINRYQLKVENVGVTTRPDQIQGWINTAKTNHLWLILVYHQIDNSGQPFARHPQDFQTDIQAVAASGIPVKTLSAAYAEISPQI